VYSVVNTDRVDVFAGVETAAVNLHRQQLADVVYYKATKTYHTFPFFTTQHPARPHTVKHHSQVHSEWPESRLTDSSQHACWRETTQPDRASIITASWQHIWILCWIWAPENQLIYARICTLSASRILPQKMKYRCCVLLNN